MPDKIQRLEKLTLLMEKAFDCGCTDKAWDKYARATYAVISENPVFAEAEQEFIDYITGM